MRETAWKDKRALVAGMARSGKAVAELLVSLGSQVTLSDTKAEIGGLENLLALGCENRLGEPAESLVEGCDLVIVSPAVQKEAPVIQKATELGIPVMAELEFAARFVQGVMVGVTGTNGKTTTCSVLGEMLRNAGKNTYVAGNIGLPLSAVALKTLPGDFCVVEVSSFQLENMRAFHPHGAAILNLRPDHLNRHGTMEAYGALKESMLQNQTADDFFVYNADDPFCAAAARRAKAKVVPFSSTQALRHGAWVQDGQVMVSGREPCSFREPYAPRERGANRGQSQSRALCAVEELSLKGRHNLENALAAAAIAVRFDVPAAVIRHTLRSFQGVEHRMENVRVLGGVRYINDSKGTNPDSSIQAVMAMDTPTVLIAGGEDKDMGFEAFAGAIAGNKNIRHVVLIGSTAEKIRGALEKEDYTACEMAGFNFAKAVERARSLAVPGGAVLLSPACASFDMFKDYEARGNTFKEIVSAL
ncbi:MAG: UDP-N-acetylmuramoyl-L-alanine--D-glutamate ligase [Firmicutes bacterium]|nr:UDP-N-acetylmuramoyl-L-alanine--D-glutamate ligase [Bacillota bacterium]